VQIAGLLDYNTEREKLVMSQICGIQPILMQVMCKYIDIAIIII